ncbi:hypothetical protein R3P38DRAFT_3215769 [Favolaschia claudopus]|uniref:Uncharacterized protein n=1 Tax=Favolaschia claudopus TaxID=2862362 RepID=A0AAV9Z6E6_9AGAR
MLQLSTTNPSRSCLAFQPSSRAASIIPGTPLLRNLARVHRPRHQPYTHFSAPSSSTSTAGSSTSLEGHTSLPAPTHPMPSLDVLGFDVPFWILCLSNGCGIDTNLRLSPLQTPCSWMLPLHSLLLSPLSSETIADSFGKTSRWKEREEVLVLNAGGANSSTKDMEGNDGGDGLGGVEKERDFRSGDAFNPATSGYRLHPLSTPLSAHRTRKTPYPEDRIRGS